MPHSDWLTNYLPVELIAEFRISFENSLKIPDPLWYMATVADQLATFKKIPNAEAQEYFVHSKFDLNPIGSWSYGCYGQIRPFRKGRVSIGDVKLERNFRGRIILLF